MKSFLLLVIAFFSFQFADAQELLMETELVSSPDVTNPKFNGGEFDKFYEFINQQFNYSSVKKEGDIVVAFTVNELGEVKKIKVLKFPNIEAASEIIRVLNISPKWEPAKRAGRPFSVEIKMPVNFQVKNNLQTSSISKSKNESLDLSKDSNGEIKKKKEFSGGLNKFYEFINANYRLPEVPGLRGEVKVSFIINEDGSIGDFKIIQNLGYGTGEELIRVLKTTGNKWSPAVKDGKPVKSTFVLPLKINIPNE